jgi:N-acetylglucosaminyldiphosphoundecaprenol N-acetyl-beta-D-mannosaminyltransferase
MNDTMYHRGPDDSGEEIYSMKEGYSVGLAQRRLSILDLSPMGHQPMHSADKRISVVYNGEIYNFREIKEELAGSYPFVSTCDTEVIIAAYLKWGIECVNRFNGMFAICDSGWVPLYLKWIYGIRRSQYAGPMIFKDVVSQGKHRMIFLGTDRPTLDSLRLRLAQLNPAVLEMTFCELPYRSVEDFDYASIAQMIEADGAQVIWIALGAPKQDYFMRRLKPYLKHGVMIGVGAAFNFYSGIEQRAPEWMIRRHLEFIYRIFQSPKKQMNRCWGIVTSLPGMLLGEWRRKKSQGYTI